MTADLDPGFSPYMLSEAIKAFASTVTPSEVKRYGIDEVGLSSIKMRLKSFSLFLETRIESADELIRRSTSIAQDLENETLGNHKNRDPESGVR